MLDRLAGNEAMKQHLQAALAGGKLAHSLLLCGGFVKTAIFCWVFPARNTIAALH